MASTQYETFKSGFRKRDTPLNADYRPLYKISIVVLALKTCSIGGKSSLNKLHFLISAAKSDLSRKFYTELMAIPNPNLIISWGIEPALNKALILAEADNLIQINGDKYSLTKKGELFVALIERDKKLLSAEKVFLAFIGKKKVTESFLNSLTPKT